MGRKLGEQHERETEGWSEWEGGVGVMKRSGRRRGREAERINNTQEATRSGLSRPAHRRGSESEGTSC